MTDSASKTGDGSLGLVVVDAALEADIRAGLTAVEALLRDAA